MHLFLVYGSDAHKQLQTATVGNEPEEARKLAQSVEQANRIVESWLLSKGGRFIAYEGGNGSAEIDAEHLGEVKEILGQFSQAIREGRVWAGVGTELKEADVAAQVAYKRGGENTVVLYTPEIAQELETEEEPLASEDMLLGPLTKFDEQQAAPGEATAVERGQAAPPSPMSPMSQGASQLPDIPGQENRPAGPAAPPPGQPQNTQQLKQAIVGVLKDIRSQVPFFEQVKEQNPTAYEAVMGLVEAMLSLAKQVMGPQAPTAQEAGLSKSEIVARYLLQKDPELAVKLATLSKALKPKSQGSGHFHGPLEFFDASVGLGKEEPAGEEHQFEEVPPEEYEKVIASRPDQGGLAQDRDYAGKRTFLNKQRTAGVTVAPQTGELQYLFSLAKGHGVPAMRFGIKMGGTNLDCFDGGLVKLYGKHGWKEVRREANWAPGGPDVVFMKFQPDAPAGVEPPLRRSEQRLAKMAKIHDNPGQPMMVWRVQNAQGDGPYNAPDAPAIVPDSEDAQPDPEEDFTHQDQAQAGYTNDTAAQLDWFEGRSKSPVLTTGPKFAFLKPEHAQEWFGDDLARLDAKGFKLVQVPAAKVWQSESGKQVMFHPAPKVVKSEELDPAKTPPKGTKLLKDALPGGLADKSDPKQFPKDLLMEGAKHELEHTDDPRIATEIAMDHLKEDPLYYRKLKAAGLDKSEGGCANCGESMGYDRTHLNCVKCGESYHELAKKGLLAAMSAAGTKDSRKGDIAKPTPVFKDEPTPNPTHHNLQLPVGTVLNGTGRQGGNAARAKAGIVIETNAEGKKVHRQQRRGRRAATALEGGGSESAQNKPPPTDQPGPTEKKGTAIGDGQG